MSRQPMVTMEFHVAREARARYQVDETLFSLTGNVVFANFHAVRVFAQKINDQRDLVRFPEQAVKPGQLNAMGLIDEILHFVVGLYREQRNTTVMEQALAWLEAKFPREAVDRALLLFVDRFPPVAVYRGEMQAKDYLAGASAGVPHRQLVLEEMLMLWLANRNPACGPFAELFDDTPLEKQSAYRPILASLHEFFATQPPFGPEQQNLVDMLQSPAIAVPNSLTGQLAYILEKWGYLLGSFLYRLLGGLDLIKEEDRPIFAGAGPARVYEFAGLELEPEHFSPDKEWMPRLVLLAKNSFVWLDQLTKKYKREIDRLDQVPDEELDLLARWGFSGLWLIGLWERSRASKQIKQLCGNPDAVASAYSLFDYQIAGDLGGEEAFQNLKDRAWQRGIRLASDMVPNHMGIDSTWVVDHPDWFIQLDHSPFPSYRFDGPDVSQDQRVGIMVEDHYYTRSDAAVVFKRRDRWTGAEQYIYHGNDGTSMPWNDTAQLNFLKPEVREAVLQTILHVARMCSVIRFDAAMTLAKKHYQRLWFPEPGTGGAIPSRADQGLTKDQFDAAMPKEFWREVVDRVAQEVPDTLLLAEAFWMMEGYFVRTLGMHRVYNSAFMNMLKNEDNANYRNVMKNTLAFNPDILKRFVNFMNNPDEETAVAQFGKGDKYFGVCTLMATLPGLPMFGHGQIEGYTEKYGMEYRRAYRDEIPDPGLVQRHEREIFPLLRRRHVFAEVENFLLYDFFTPQGHVNEDVFAYSNGTPHPTLSPEGRGADWDRGLVIFHNKYATVQGWIRSSVGYRERTGGRNLVQKNLGQGMGLHAEADYFSIFRDQVTGLEYIRSSRELSDKGLYVELAAFKYHIFLDWREVRDNEWHQYAHLAAYLDGRGVPSIEDAKREIFLQPIHHPFKELVNAGMFRYLLDNRLPDAKGKHKALDEAEQKTLWLLRAIKQFTGGTGDETALAARTRQELATVLRLPTPKPGALQALDFEALRKAAPVSKKNEETPIAHAVMLGWVLVHSLGKMTGAANFEQQSRSWLDEWLLGRILAGTFRDLGIEEPEAWKAVETVKLLTSHQRWFAVESPYPMAAPVYPILEMLMRDVTVQQYLQVNRFQDILWFSQEGYEQLLMWLTVAAAVDSLADPARPESVVKAELAARSRLIADLQRAGEKAEHQVEKLLETAKVRV